MKGCAIEEQKDDMTETSRPQDYAPVLPFFARIKEVRELVAVLDNEEAWRKSSPEARKILRKEICAASGSLIDLTKEYGDDIVKILWDWIESGDQ